MIIIQIDTEIVKISYPHPNMSTRGEHEKLCLKLTYICKTLLNFAAWTDCDLTAQMATFNQVARRHAKHIFRL